MLDTVAAVINIQEGLDPKLFEREQISRAVGADSDGEDRQASVRYYNVTRYVDGRREPALTYFPQTRVGPRLRLEVSLPKFLGRPLAILSQADVDKALDGIDGFLTGRDLALHADGIRGWKCVRLDVLHSWYTGQNTSAYISALQNVQLANADRTPYDYGVVWKASKGYKWIKFYDKQHELGLKRSGWVLRFEVSNYRNSVRYMAQKRHKVDQDVLHMTRKELIWKELRYHIRKLGLLESNFGSREMLQHSLVQRYGTTGAGSAYWFLECYQKYGSACFSDPHNLMKKSNYYKWLGKLKADGFLAPDERGEDVVKLRGLPRLMFPESPDDFAVETMGEDWGDDKRRLL